MVHAFRRNRALTASVVVILLAILCAGGTSRAQAPVFKGRVDLVRLDVVVVNTDGDPVSELKPSDFAVTLAGQQSRVVLFEYVASDPSGSPSTLNSPVADAAGSPGQEPPVRTILFVLDDLGVLPGGIKELTIAAGRLIEGMGSQDLVGIATTSAPTAPIAPTLNRSSVVEVLRNAGMSGRLDASPAGLYVSVNEAIEIETGTPRETSVQVAQRECAVGETGWRGSGRASAPAVDDQCARRVQSVARMIAAHARRSTESQVAALSRLILALRSAPAPRVLILLTGGVALHPRYGMLEQVQQVARSAAEAEVQFYSLTEVADGVNLSDRIEGRSSARRAENKFLTEGIQTLAAAAGGDAFRVVGQADRFLRRVLRETSGFYRLGVEPPADGRKGALEVEVKVARRGVKVHTRQKVIR